ncbi:hypothetical protein [Ewingella americana]|uniref:Uncharacterized protein n=1 Tax=Ewingella americana TaxID=41202 RepID=A0A502GH68_9GAMM|nr:hypothetical protein [Ewingella americana]TPG60073.1 hypothetical protein EAH77_16020 [Ewingella americana]
MSKIDEIRASKWNQVAGFQRNHMANGVVVSIYRRVLEPFAAAHSQVCSLLRHTAGAQIPPITLAEAESSVMDTSGRLFPNPAYTPNPIMYREFAPFKPPVLQNVWKLDNGQNPPSIDTDLSVLKAVPNPDETAINLQKSKDILTGFNTLSLSYLSSEGQIKSINQTDLISLVELLELEKTSILITGGTSSGGTTPVVTPIVKSYNPEFLLKYSQYIKTRTESLSEIISLYSPETESIHSLYYRWLEFFIHRTEGALSKYKMSELSLGVSKDSLRIAESKHNILQS